MTSRLPLAVGAPPDSHGAMPTIIITPYTVPDAFPLTPTLYHCLVHSHRFGSIASPLVPGSAWSDLSSGASTPTSTLFPHHAGSNASTGIPKEHVSLHPSRSRIHLHQHALTARVSAFPKPGLSASPCLRHWVYICGG